MSSDKPHRKIRRSKYDTKPPIPLSTQVLISEIFDWIFIRIGEKIETAEKILDSIKLTEITHSLNDENIKYPLRQADIKENRILYTDDEPISQPNNPLIIIQSYPQEPPVNQKEQFLFTFREQFPSFQKQKPNRANSRDVSPQSQTFIIIPDLKLKKQEQQRQIDDELRQIMLRKRQGRVKKQTENVKERIKQRYQKYRFNKEPQKLSNQLDSTKPSISFSVSKTIITLKELKLNQSHAIMNKMYVQTQNNSPEKIHRPVFRIMSPKSLHRTQINSQQKSRVEGIRSLHSKSIIPNQLKLKKIRYRML